MELLIVVVIIAILAVITVVAYNSIQDRSIYSSAQQGLATLKKAVLLFEADTGAYPSTGSSWRRYDSAGTATIPGLVPQYISVMPTPPSTSYGGTWYYNSNGVDYKLLYLTPGA